MAKKIEIINSHWYSLIEGLQDSSKQFYADVTQTIKARQIPDIKFDSVKYRESGVLSAKREYLRVQRKEYIFDICAAPFGTGYFFSMWSGETLGFIWSKLLSIPILGSLCWRVVRPATYYQIDTDLMAEESIRKSVLEVIDQRTKAQGLRQLTEAERKPVFSELYRRLKS